MESKLIVTLCCTNQTHSHDILRALSGKQTVEPLLLQYKNDIQRPRWMSFSLLLWHVTKKGQKAPVIHAGDEWLSTYYFRFR